jgi:hypothetical protein
LTALPRRDDPHAPGVLEFIIVGIAEDNLKIWFAEDWNESSLLTATEQAEDSATFTVRNAMPFVILVAWSTTLSISANNTLVSPFCSFR